MIPRRISANGRKYDRSIQEEINTWIPYRRGLRPHDRPAYDQVCEAGITYMEEDFLTSRLLASEGLFMATAFDQQKQIAALRKQIEDLKVRVSKRIKK